MIVFRDDKGKVLVEYESYISDDEIKATKELLEYENSCIVDVEIKGRQLDIERYI